MIARLAAVAWLECLHLWRDRPSLSLMLLVPAAQLVLFGAAVNINPGHASLVIAGPPGPQLSAAAAAAADDPELSLLGVRSSGGAERAVRGGRALLGVEIPGPSPSSGRLLAGPVRIYADDSDPADSGPGLAAVEIAALRTSSANPPIRLELHRLFNPALRSSWALLPGLIGTVVMISMLLLGSQTLVREREAGTFEALLITPVTAADAMLGKLAPYLGVATLQGVAVLTISTLVFGLPLQGAWVTLMLAVPVFASAHLLLGFLLSAIAETRLQALQAAVFLYLPSILLSGFAFPFRGMPAWAKALGETLPMTHWVRASRAVLLRAEGAGIVVREMGPVAAITLGAGACALLIYRRRSL